MPQCALLANAAGIGGVSSAAAVMFATHGVLHDSENCHELLCCLAQGPFYIPLFNSLLGFGAL